MNVRSGDRPEPTGALISFLLVTSRFLSCFVRLNRVESACGVFSRKRAPRPAVRERAPIERVGRPAEGERKCDNQSERDA